MGGRDHPRSAPVRGGTRRALGALGLGLAVGLAGTASLAASDTSAHPRRAAAAQPQAGHVGRGLAAVLERGAGGTRTRAEAAQPQAEVVADVVLRRYSDDLRARIEAAGGHVRALSAEYLRASVRISSVEQAEAIAALPEVRWIARDHGPRRRAGSVTSRAVEALDVTAIAGAPSNLTGADQVIGILSDSFARTPGVVDFNTTTNGTPVSAMGNSSPVTLRGSRPQDSGDLPDTVRLRRDDADDGFIAPLLDEGAAMAELAHDIAPGAGIVFYTAFISLAEFAAGVDDLCTSKSRGGGGATVLVDDIGYLEELMYQPDVLAQEVSRCVDRGRPFFSAAGNVGDSAFRQRYVDVDPDDTDNDDTDFDQDGNPTAEGADFHDWDPPNGDGMLAITLDPGEGFTAVLQWNQPALSTPQNGSNGPLIDLDLYVSTSQSDFFANTTTNGESFEDQEAGDPLDGLDPIEVVSHTNSNTGGVQTVYLAVDHWAGDTDKIPQGGGSTDLEFRLVLFERGGDGDGAGAEFEYVPDGPGMYGHPVAEGAVSVAAVPWWEAPGFDPQGLGPTMEIDPEPFSARGGEIPYFFRADGSFAASSSEEPDLAAVDGNNTTFFGQSSGNLPEIDGEPDGFPNFFGTSAAAPNAAAVAALLLEDDCTQSPAALESKLKDAAIDVTGERAAAGVDDVTGSGLIDADAIALAGGTAECGSDDDDGGGGGALGWPLLVGLLGLLGAAGRRPAL